MNKLKDARKSMGMSQEDYDRMEALCLHEGEFELK